MPRLRVIEPLAFDEDGELVVDGRYVHFQQGELDGACGFYCLLIALAIHGEPIAPRTHSAYKRSTRIGKAVRAQADRFIRGTRISDLREFLRAYAGARAPYGLRRVTYRPGGLWARLCASLDADRPAICQLEGHWVVGVGYSAPSSDGAATELLILDPSAPAPLDAYWNDVLTRFPPRQRRGRPAPEESAVDVGYGHHLTARKARNRDRITAAYVLEPPAPGGASSTDT